MTVAAHKQNPRSHLSYFEIANLPKRISQARNSAYVIGDKEMAEKEMTRRAFLATSIAAGVVRPAQGLLPSEQQASVPEPVRSIPAIQSDPDYRTLISHADLDYTTPVGRSEAGQPIGNGRMGSLVWTTPSTLKFQINRVDVHAQNHDTASFPERNLDYSSGCGMIDLNFGDYGEDVFSGLAFNQHLSVYDGMVTVRGNGVRARVLACPNQDLIAVELEDTRITPAPISIDLRMLRYANQYIEHENYQLTKQHSSEIVTRNHRAISTLDIRDDSIALKQQFREGEFYNASAVVIKTEGRACKAIYANESTVRLSAAAGRGKFVVLIASASSYNAEEDITAKATAELAKVDRLDFGSLATQNAHWWHSFWSKGFIRLEGSDSAPQTIEKNYTYYLYVMAASSRGAYIPRYGGMLWYTNGDMRQWGAQHWWHNASCDYNALPMANRPELMQPFISMYSGMYERCAIAARQQWGSKGIFIPEVTWFDGLEILPEDIAEEMRELYLVRKPWEERSLRFQSYAETKTPHNSRWNWKGRGKWIDGRFIWDAWQPCPYGPTTHILSSGAKIAHLFWQIYEHTQDGAFLREQAYPIIRGVAEFYANFPNLKLGSDGIYHIHYVNNHEPVWGATDAQEEISAIRGMLPVAIKAAEILRVDADLRRRWTELLEKIAPLPTNNTLRSGPARDREDRERWISGLPPAFRGDLNSPRVVPAAFYDLCCVETEDEAMRKMGHATFEAIFPHGIDSRTPVRELDWDPVAAANLGRSEDVRHLLLGQIQNMPAETDFCDWVGSGAPAVLPNRMTLREGPGALGVQRLGRMAQTLHASLLQSVPPKPGGDPVLHVFPAWPKDWNAQFKLSARGGFVVTASWRNGRVEFIELGSIAGERCHLRNPWGADPVRLRRNGASGERLSGALLHFETHRGEILMLVPSGTT